MRKEICLSVILFFSLFIVGCSSMSEKVEESPAPEAAPQPADVDEVAQAEPEPEPEIPLETTFYFDFDDSTLHPNARLAIEAHAERLKSNSQVIRIEGYADDRGTQEYNIKLGQRRANAVRDLLITNGVESSQIQTVSYGEDRPVVLGNGESVWQKNRRVELK